MRSYFAGIAIGAIVTNIGWFAAARVKQEPITTLAGEFQMGIFGILILGLIVALIVEVERKGRRDRGSSPSRLSF